VSALEGRFVRVSSARRFRVIFDHLDGGIRPVNDQGLPLSATGNAVNTRSEFMLWWIVGTVVGWIAAIIAILATYLVWVLLAGMATRYWGLESLGRMVILSVMSRLWTYLAYLIGGATFGFAQWQFALRNEVRKRAWIGASALIGVIGLLGLPLAIQLSPVMVSLYRREASGMYTGVRVVNTWPIAVIVLGVAVGLGIGLPQWLILRRYSHQANWWIPASMVASAAGLAVFVGIVYIAHRALVAGVVGVCIVPIVYSAITGAVLFSLFQHPKTGQVSPITTEESL
jgi:hypothetical protein